MAKTLCKVGGLIFLIVGLVGFATPNLMGFHLTLIHNVIHIVTGLIALYLGFAGSYAGAKTFCLVFGVVYLLIAIIGFMAPGTLASILGHAGPMSSADFMPDNVFHLIVGIVFLAVGMMRPAVVATVR
ncbi:MAG: DUF4383 domain-containing protein [Acidobacteriota bacterium]